MATLTEPAKCLLLVSLLTKDHIISNNGKAFLKELILRRDPRLAPLISKFEEKQSSGDVTFLEKIHELIVAEAQSIYDDLFSDTSLEVGKMLSKKERELKDLSEEKSLIYGEVEFTSFYRVLRKINPRPGLVFYDLGSGTGKALFIARLTQDFSKCIGVEILHGLHTQASMIIERYNAAFKDYLSLGQSGYARAFEGSFVDFDWSDGDVVFANSTCFTDELMGALSKQAEKLKPGSIVVTFTKGMTTKAFELLERKRYRMSWGPATVFIHRRLNPDGTAPGPARLNILPSDSVTYEEEEYGGEGAGSYTLPHRNPPTTYDYDDDIDYGDEDEEEDEDEDDDDEEGESDEGDEGEEGEGSTGEEEEEEEGEEGDDEQSPDEALAKNFYQSPSKTPTPSVVTPSPRSQAKSTPNANVGISPKADSKGASISSPWRTSTSNTPAENKFSPSSSSRGSISMASPAGLNSSEAFAMMNSPLDEALLRRKRSAPKMQSSPSEDM